MGVILYKDGVQDIVDPMHLASHLESGWSLTKGDDDGLRNDEEGNEKEGRNEKNSQDADGHGTEKEVSDDGSKEKDVIFEGMENKEIRELAKKHDIENWDDARINTLKRKLKEVM